MGSCSRLPYCLIWMIPGRLFFSLVLNPAWQEWWNHEAAWVHHFKPIAGGNFRGNTLNFKTFRCAYPSDSFQICGLGVHVKIMFVYDIHVLCIYIYLYIYNLSPFHGFLPSGLWEPFAADVRNLCGQGRCCHAALKICSKQPPKYGLKGPHSKMLKYDSIRILCFCWVSFGKESPLGCQRVSRWL